MLNASNPDPKTPAGEMRIAIFRALFLGDTLCIIPVARAIRHRYPKAFISLIGLPWQREVTERFSAYFDELIEFPGWPGLPEQEFEPRVVVDFLRTMQDRKFDLVLQMQGNGELTNAMCSLWGGKKVVGLRKPEDLSFAGDLFPVSADDEHEVTRFLKLLDALQIPRQGSYLEFPLTEQEEALFRNESRHIGLPVHEYICLHPGSKDPKRRWPAESFALIGDRVAKLGYKVVLTGSDKEIDVVERVRGHMRSPSINALEAFRPMTLGSLAAIIKYAKLLVSNDTGVSHVAAGLSVPSVILFSPYSRLSRWSPENESLHKTITPEQAKSVDYVWSMIQQQLLVENPVSLK